MTAYGYVRVSTTSQAKDGHSLGVQSQQIRAYCMDKDMDLEDVFTDEAETAATPLVDRPAGRTMLSLLKRGDHVVVTKLDRAWRSVMDAEQTMSRWREEGVTPHIIALKIDYDSPMGRFFFQLLAAFAEFERTIIAERIREGVRAKIAKLQNEGKTWGPFVRYGWQREDDGTIVEDEDEQAVMSVAVALRAGGGGRTQLQVARLMAKAGYVGRNGQPVTKSTVRVLLDSYRLGRPGADGA